MLGISGIASIQVSGIGGEDCKRTSITRFTAFPESPKLSIFDRGMMRSLAAVASSLDSLPFSTSLASSLS